MRLSRSPFGSGLAIGPKNLPSSSSRLRRGYDKTPRGAMERVVIDVRLLLFQVLNDAARRSLDFPDGGYRPPDQDEEQPWLDGVSRQVLLGNAVLALAT